jgi:hypothetical protein
MSKDKILDAFEKNQIDINNLFKLAQKEANENTSAFAVNASPVYILNLDDQNAQATAGIYLITRKKEELEEILKEATKADMDKINPDTSVLLFSQRHIIELANVLYGAFVPVINADEDNKRWVNILIGSIIAEIFNPIYYSEIQSAKDKALEVIIANNMDHTKDEFFKKFSESISIILDYIWFVPYAKLDEFTSKMVEEYNKENSL